MAGFLKRLFGGTSAGPTPPPLVSNRLNLFAGQFGTEMAATDYAIGFGDGPSLSTDLGGVGIGTDDVEIIHGADRIAAARTYLHPVGRPLTVGDANTLILLSDRGYAPDGMAETRVRFVGQCDAS